MMKLERRVICAGTFRSGSTWLFNVVRIIFKINKYNFKSGFCGIFPPFVSNNIIKTHDYFPYLISQNTLVITSFRDIREIAASAARSKIDLKEKVPHLTNHSTENILFFLEKIILQYEKWKKYSSLDIKFYDILYNKKNTISKIANTLKQKVNVDEIFNHVEGLKSPLDNAPDPVSLLWPSHITDPERTKKYYPLDQECIEKIKKLYPQYILDYI
jgi:hypothetical protein